MQGQLLPKEESINIYISWWPEPCAVLAAFCTLIFLGDNDPSAELELLEPVMHLLAHGHVKNNLLISHFHCATVFK